MGFSCFVLSRTVVNAMLRFIWGNRGSREDIEQEQRELALEYIEKFTTRLKSSTFIDDRRSAMLSLKNYCDEYPLVKFRQCLIVY